MQIPLAKIPPHLHERLSVVRSIDAPLDTLTVNGICAKCGITRKKFYSLFETKQQIIYWYVELCASLTLQEIGIERSWRDGVSTFLELIDEQRPFLSADAPTLANKPKSHFWELGAKRLANIERAISICGKSPMTPRLRQEVALYSETVPRLVNQWLLPNDFEGRDDYVQFWLDCVPRGLYDALDIEGR